MNNSEIYNCPECEDRDCALNCLGLCNDISTILYRIPEGMYTCTTALIGFNRNDYPSPYEPEKVLYKLSPYKP